MVHGFIHKGRKAIGASLAGQHGIKKQLVIYYSMQWEL
jgi:hypothetical protein